MLLKHNYKIAIIIITITNDCCGGAIVGGSVKSMYVELDISQPGRPDEPDSCMSKKYIYT